MVIQINDVQNEQCSLLTLKYYNLKIGITGLIFVCAFFIDVIVWYKAHNIKFVEESTEIDIKKLPELTELMPIDEKQPLSDLDI